jgi:ketosteroid isomerase-like protein
VFPVGEGYQPGRSSTISKTAYPGLEIETRAEDLPHTVRAIRYPHHDIPTEDGLIRVLGDVALIHARTTYAKADDQRGAERYTGVWARREGRWECVAANVTRP